MDNSFIDQLKLELDTGYELIESSEILPALNSSIPYVAQLARKVVNERKRRRVEAARVVHGGSVDPNLDN